ncbi:MAG TPA: tRNA pseudouridine(13) synthase TruD [Gammaproteobacteria bacterium]|nr:tRNA pseudouridine(13) synthase TruD [Gammaproteobacteria bacterium]
MNEIPLELPRAFGPPLGTARLRVEPEDFQVDEIPLLAPDGAGEHVWLQVEKCNANTRWVAQRLAAHAGVSPRAVSYAGLKDRRAVTRQWFSVHLPGRAGPDWPALAIEGVKVLAVARHSRKLRIGALRGNRFRIRLRQVRASAAGLEARLHQLRAGVPNGFGAQRFGRGGDNLRQAAALFAGRRRRVSRPVRGLYLSAVRAALFNRVLAARIAAGNWQRALPGDVLALDGRSAVFPCEQPDETIHARCGRGEIHPTGPLCGQGGAQVAGEAAALEAEVLAPWREWIEGLVAARLEAARRPLRVRPSDLTWQRETDADWVLSFGLPAGSYASLLLHQLLELEIVAGEGA